MSAECYTLAVSNNTTRNTIVFSSDSSLIDMLNQQSNTETRKDTTSHHKQKQNSEFDHTNHLCKHDKLSTLFNTTGRERNSTGPLKQWLYEHQDHPYPKESDKQELMRQTNMSALQITIWFTNARVKMRKEKKLSFSSNSKKNTKKKPEDILDELVSYIDEIFPNTSTLPSKEYIIAYSCLNSEQMTDLRHLASLFSNHIAISDCVDDHTTHLIIGKEEQSLLCPLTTKLFQSIARHLFIISPRWINDCLKANDIIDEMNYEIRGDIPFGRYHDGMRKSRLSKQVKLFENCQFFIQCNHCQNSMSKNELVSLVQLCHGSLLHRFPLITTTIDHTILTIVLCNEVLPFENSNQKQLFELSRSNGVFFLNPEWIIESIVQFSLQPFDFYEEKF